MAVPVSRRLCLAFAVASLSGGLVTTTSSPAQAGGEAARVGTARLAVQDAAGATWAADRGFTGGTLSAVGSGTAIAGTQDDALYRTEHWGMTGFQQPVEPGTYDVTVRLAEIYWNAPGKRVFDVSAEGAPALRNIDIYAAVGKNRAYDKTFRVTVDDGRLDLGFTSTKNFAKVSAVAITKVATVPAPGVVRPDAGNTGVPSGTALTPYYGNLTIRTPGARYDALDVHGFVTIQAPDVKITRSVIRGGVATTNIGLVTNYTPTATNFVLEDSELVPEYPSVWLDAIKGANYTARRVNAHGTTDLVKVHGDNVRVESSWLHDTVYRASDPNQGGGPTHNDGVQVLGGKNIHILGNSISGASNAALQVTQDYSETTDLEFSRNWADGGKCTVNLANKPLPSMTGISAAGNRFGRNTLYDDCAIISSRMTTLLAAGNVWQDSGLPVRVRDGG